MRLPSIAAVARDLFNDYPGADSYHHETHVDKAYNLTDAASLLEQLSQYEETETGCGRDCPRATPSARRQRTPTATRWPRSGMTSFRRSSRTPSSSTH
jgi:hypothetical protein